MTKRPTPPADPWQPPPVEPLLVYAFKALRDGVASPGQQQSALRFLIEGLAGTYDLPFRPGGPEGERASCFAAGKQFVGQQVVRLLNFDVSTLPPTGGTSHGQEG